jgi:hypothetical protein
VCVEAFFILGNANKDTTAYCSRFACFGASSFCILIHFECKFIQNKYTVDVGTRTFKNKLLYAYIFLLHQVASAWIAAAPSSRFPLDTSSLSARSHLSCLGSRPERRSALWPSRVRNNMWRNKATPRSDFELAGGRDNAPSSDGSLSPSSSVVAGKDKDEEAGSSSKAGSGKDRDKDDDKSEPVLYAQRWVQLGILSMLALISDMVCFSVAANPRVFVSAFDGHSPTELVQF